LADRSLPLTDVSLGDKVLHPTLRNLVLNQPSEPNTDCEQMIASFEQTPCTSAK
jgi:hypothetical protein